MDKIALLIRLQTSKYVPVKGRSAGLMPRGHYPHRLLPSRLRLLQATACCLQKGPPQRQSANRPRYTGTTTSTLAVQCDKNL
jgi:hypothetical protein